jgi:uncharacterized protein HemY
MEREAQTATQALELTDRSLRRLLRHLKEAEWSADDDDLEKEIRRARRQLRRNHELLAAREEIDGD